MSLHGARGVTTLRLILQQHWGRASGLRKCQGSGAWQLLLDEFLGSIGYFFRNESTRSSGSLSYRCWQHVLVKGVPVAWHSINTIIIIVLVYLHCDSNTNRNYVALIGN